MKKTTAYARKRRAPHAQNPVEIAINRRKAFCEFQSQVTSLRIKMLMCDDGEDATEILAALAVVIGTPTEAGARLYGHSQPWIRQLHGALKTIHLMCMEGYKWQSQYAAALSRAVEISAENRPELDARTFEAAWIEANGLARQILTHSVTQDSIV